MCSVFGMLSDECNAILDPPHEPRNHNTNEDTASSVEEEGAEDVGELFELIITLANVDIEVCSMFGILKPLCEEVLEALNDDDDDKDNNYEIIEQSFKNTSNFLCSQFESNSSKKCKITVRKLASILAENLEEAYSIFIHQEEEGI